MGSYEGMQKALDGLGKVDIGDFRRKLERGIKLLDDSTNMINDYLGGLRDSKVQRQFYVIEGGRQ